MVDVQIRSSNIENIGIGDLNAKFNAAEDRILRYYIDFRHKELQLHKELSAPDLPILQNKVDTLMASWDNKWSDHQSRKKIAAGKELAEKLTIEAISKIETMSLVLAHTLDVDDAVDWDSLKDTSNFPGIPKFSKPKPKWRKSTEPELSYPPVSILDRLFGGKKRKYQKAEATHADEKDAWREKEVKRHEEHKEVLSIWKEGEGSHNRNSEESEVKFYRQQKSTNESVDALKGAWADGDVDAVVEHASIVLEASDYADLFEKSFEIDFDPDEGLLLLEYELPSLDIMPITKTVRFVQSTGELTEKSISAREQKANYDSVCYQICLRTIHEIFEADTHGHIEKILFNGISEYVDKGTGQDVRSSIMSILVNRDEFLATDLARVEAKACFKALKGVSAASLASLAPIAPIMKLNREDRRFIEGRATVDGLDEATNLAEMDWEEFEHLVRELFDKEFATRGGEVRITQSSRDGGVDAVAFDPDPITGGKIVIQAKRYTKTVGVAAVRDLYGTTLNEGASKGILVTTADYGPDAYKFAADKPITLMTGANLLHLLTKHGIKAKIDLRAAREALAAKQ